jgi:hypothetical protein
MKRNLLIFILFLFLSCRTYIDSDFTVENIDKGISLEYGKNYNTLSVKFRTPFSTDTEIHFYQPFITNIPKRIISWRINDEKYFFEYIDNQILVISSKTIDYDIVSDWKVSEVSNDQISYYLFDYLYEKGIDIDTISNKNNRKSMLYTDDKTEILLFNMKKQELSTSLEILKSFKYINNVSDSSVSD